MINPVQRAMSFFSAATLTHPAFRLSSSVALTLLVCSPALAQRVRPGTAPAGPDTPKQSQEPAHGQKAGTPQPAGPSAQQTAGQAAGKATDTTTNTTTDAKVPATPAPTQEPAPQGPSIPSGLTSTGATAPQPKAPTTQKNSAGSPQEDPSVSLREMRRRVWTSSYRPAHNPVRFQGTVRAGMYAGGQSSRTSGGRGLGIEIEPGITRNFFGVSAVLGAQLGRYHRVPLSPLPFHPELKLPDRNHHPGYKTPASFSAGLRAGIGRLALQGTGFIDPRIGYEFNWSGVKRLSGHRPTKLAASHGPSLRIDAGFLSLPMGRPRKYRRIFGASLGWNMTVGGIGIDLPTSHFVFLGVFAQMN